MRIEASQRASAVDQVKPANVQTERSVDMVVLAVDVCRDRATDTHEARPWRDRDEVAVGYQFAHQRVERDAGRHRDGVGIPVEMELVDRVAELDDKSAGILRRVAVRPAESARDQSSWTGALDDRCHRQGVDVLMLRGRGGCAAPAGEQAPVRH